ncbi:hypothetical protein NEMBOFW57_008391 [Staphylotrichum longicolle]|uniref:Uncharacterized protein n=1 Tax=Staphylotrichum longicolle TaxID=669026 RepID=A0AAD4EVI8_9PEZI|nr:hypothetical protein NEMBOFW57_008391 [Staphylotrichum longicolle]
MDAPYYLLDPRRIFPAIEATRWLGRIVLDYKDPSSWYTPDTFPSALKLSPIEVTIENFHASLAASQDLELKAGLTDLASGLASAETRQEFDFQPTTVKSILQTALGSKMSPGGRPMYFIVGLLIMTDTRFSDKAGRGRRVGGDISIPATAVAAAAGLGVPLPVETADPFLGAQKTSTVDRSMEGHIPGSYVFGVEYKTVRRMAYSLIKPFTPRMQEYGPRNEGDRVFGHQDKGEGQPQALDDMVVKVDNEDEIWTDELPKGEVRETDIGQVTLVRSVHV